MGAGRSQEAEFLLRGDVAAGTWTLVGDGIITAEVDVHFEVLLRRNGADELLAEWTNRFVPRGGGNFDAIPYEVTAEVDEVVVGEGNPDGAELIFRYTGTGTDVPMGYVPNGEGPEHNGRYPNLTLP